MELYFSGFAKPTDILTDATPFAGASIALIKAQTDYQPKWMWSAIQAGVAGGISPYSTVAGTWANNADGFALARLLNSTQALNDEIAFHVFFPNLTAVTLSIVANTGTAKGISTISLDGVSQGTIDWYTAGNVSEVLKTISITPQKVGINALNIKMASKNASSTAYAMGLISMWIA